MCLGFGTSSVYCDGALRSKGFPFECYRKYSQVIAVKAHEAKHERQFRKVVLLIRNPYDALLAYAMYTRGGHTGVPSDVVTLAGRFASVRPSFFFIRSFVLIAFPLFLALLRSYHGGQTI